MVELATSTQANGIVSEPRIVEALPETHVIGSAHRELIAVMLGRVPLSMVIVGKRHGANGKEDRKSGGELGKDSHGGREREYRLFERAT